MNAIRLAPEERRTQILDAVVPVILEHGAAVTSKQLAEAAGVAEGTLFRVFENKECLLGAVLAREAETRLVVPNLLEREFATLEEFLTTTVNTMVDRFTRLFALAMALGPAMGAQHSDENHARVLELHGRIARALEPFRDELRVSPEVAAEAIITLVFSASSGWGGPRISDRGDVLKILLHGIAHAPEGESTAPDH